MGPDRQAIDAVQKRGWFDSNLDSRVLALDQEEKERLAKGFRRAGSALSEEMAKSKSEEKGKESSPPEKKASLGIWDRIMFFFMQLFTGISKEDFIKNRELAIVAARVKKVTPALYNFRGNQLLGPFGEAIFKLSTATTPMRQLCEACQLTGSEGVGKGFAEYFIKQLVPELPDFDEQYNLEAVKGKREHYAEKTLKEVIAREIDQILAQISYEKRAEINLLYANMVAYHRVSFFSYYALLRRFGNATAEGEFSFADGSESLFDLTRLEELLLAVDWNLDMRLVFSALNDYARLLAEGEVNDWTTEDNDRLYSAVAFLLRDDRLGSIIKLIMRKPGRGPSVRRIPVNPIEEMRAQVQTRLHSRVLALQHQIGVEELEKRLENLFGKITLGEIEFYNENTNRRLLTMDLPLFTHCKQIQATKAFQQTIYDAMIKTALSPLVMDGEFVDKGLQNTLGDYFYHFNDFYLEVAEFEKKVSSNTVEGEKLQNLINRFSGDPPTRKIVVDKIHYLNNLAAKSLRELAALVNQALIPLSAAIKDGKELRKPEFVHNIRQIGGNKNKLFLRALQRVYEVTNLFAGIMAPYIKEA